MVCARVCAYIVCVCVCDGGGGDGGVISMSESNALTETVHGMRVYVCGVK